jgi:hypothetical protein
MHPISSERVKFIRARIIVLDAMFRELTRRRYLFGAQASHIQSAIDILCVERLSLQLEAEILQNHLNKEKLNND